MNTGGDPREAHDERQDYRCPSQAAGCQEARRPAGGNGPPAHPGWASPPGPSAGRWGQARLVAATRGLPRVRSRGQMAKLGSLRFQETHMVESRKQEEI